MNLIAHDIAKSFPDPKTCQIAPGRTRYYKTPDGNFPSVTTILKVLGLSTNALIAWSARVEREAILEACAEVYAEGTEGGPADFAAMVEARIGQAKQHQKILAQAGDIGTLIHQAVQHRLQEMM